MANEWSDWSEDESTLLSQYDTNDNQLQGPGNTQNPASVINNQSFSNTSIGTNNNDGNEGTNSEIKNGSQDKVEDLTVGHETYPVLLPNEQTEPTQASRETSTTHNDEAENPKTETKVIDSEPQTVLSSTFSEYRNPSENEKESDGDFGNKNIDTASSSSSDESIQENNIKHEKQCAQKKKRRINKLRTRKKLKYLSSSDEDIPLSFYAKHAWNTSSAGNSDLDNTYDPEKEEDINSTDSEYQDMISKEILKKVKNNQSLKREWDKTVEKLKKNKKSKFSKEKSSPRKLKKKKTMENKVLLQKEGTSNTSTCVLKQVLEQSANLAKLQQQLIESQETNIDALLAANDLVRYKIKPYGNCFFEASGRQIGMDPQLLRQELCKALEENMEDYIAFVLNRHHPDDEETFVTDYLSEIEKLKEDGFWTSSVADLLPLVLANYSKRNIVIYTNNAEQQVLSIKPTNSDSVTFAEQRNSIKLVYTSIPGVLEHYDACFENEQEEMYLATPLIDDISHKQNEPQNNENLPTPKQTTPKKGATPRKKAIFITPEKKLLTRKRKATPENWKKNIRKKLRLSGANYTSADGRLKAARSIKPVNCSKCRLKCETKITNEQRQQLFDAFWSLANYERQKDYVCARIEEKGTKTYLDGDGRTKSKRKQVARKFFLEIESEKYSVCKKFFLNTLSIGRAYIDHAMKCKKDGHFTGNDLRGKHVPHNKLSKSRIDEVKKHIESFPRVNAHYVRKETNRQFLAPELTLRKMYDLYVEKCKSNDRDPVKLETYRNVFNKNYNLSFHVPKKDQCNTCNVYHRALEEGTVTAEQKDDYEKHQQRKKRAREGKETDKIKAQLQSNVHVACFDLQSVLYTPCSLVSVMYYMRKLCCYNLTFYSLGDHKGTCFVWSEVDAKRGASEVATCLRLHLQSLPVNVDHVVLYSDACGGQNRNKIIASCLLHSVVTLPNIKVIDHKFLESGHTHMEVDSMHAAVEFAKKKKQKFLCHLSGILCYKWQEDEIHIQLYH